MDTQEGLKCQFDFGERRAITEAVPVRAGACWYDSQEDQDEELAECGEYFDLNILPDHCPQDLFSL